MLQRLIALSLITVMSGYAFAHQEPATSDIGFLRWLLQKQPNPADMSALVPEHQDYPAMTASYQIAPDSPDIHMGMRLQCLEEERSLQLEAAKDDLLIMVCGKKEHVGFVYLAAEGLFMQEPAHPKRQMYLSLFQLDQPLTTDLVDSLVLEFGARQLQTLDESRRLNDQPIHEPYIDPYIVHQLLSQLMVKHLRG